MRADSKPLLTHLVATFEWGMVMVSAERRAAMVNPCSRLTGRPDAVQFPGGRALPQGASQHAPDHFHAGALASFPSFRSINGPLPAAREQNRRFCHANQLAFAYPELATDLAHCRKTGAQGPYGRSQLEQSDTRRLKEVHELEAGAWRTIWWSTLHAFPGKLVAAVKQLAGELCYADAARMLERLHQGVFTLMPPTWDPYKVLLMPRGRARPTVC